MFDHRSGCHIEVEGARVYVESIGRNDADALVLLHGGLMDLETFNPLAAELSEGFRLIAIDSRGHGRSTLGPKRLTYALMERDVRAAIRHLGLERFSIVGHSDGGITALRLAASGPPGLRKLVAIGAQTHAPAQGTPARALYQEITPPAWRQMFPEGVAAYQRLNPEPDFDRLLEAARAMWLNEGADNYPGEAASGIAQELLVVRGDDDDLTSRIETARLADSVAKARFLNVPFAGHSVHEEEPGLVGAAIRRFLAG